MSRSSRIHRHLHAAAAEAEWVMTDPLLGSVRKFGAATILAAGPWLVAVAALAIISVTMTPLMSYAAIEDLRLTVVYAFCIAPLLAGPIGAVAARASVHHVDHRADATADRRTGRRVVGGAR